MSKGNNQNRLSWFPPDLYLSIPPGVNTGGNQHKANKLRKSPGVNMISIQEVFKEFIIAHFPFNIHIFAMMSFSTSCSTQRKIKFIVHFKYKKHSLFCLMQNKTHNT